MSVSFATFIERISPTRVKLKFTMWHDTVELYVDQRVTHHVNFKDYTDEEWNEIDFESLKEYPCIMNAYIGNSTACVFGIPNADIVNEWMKVYIKSRYPENCEFGSVFMDHRASQYWLKLCMRYDPNLEKVIREETAKKLGMMPVQTIDPKLKKINECIDLLVGYDKWAAENLKKEIADILRGVKPDEEIQTCNDGIKTDKVVAEN